MDQETLERLMLDDALGALSVDASELLAAYARTLPGGDERLAGWQRVAATARAAMPSESAEALPPFPVRRTVSNPWRMVRMGLSVAAVLAIGVAIGSWMPRGPGAPAQVAVVTQAIVAEMPSGGGVRDFWSTQRLLASALGRKHESPSAWHWTSPITQPEMDGVK